VEAAGDETAAKNLIRSTQGAAERRVRGRTSRIFDKILPSILDCTMRIWPCVKATTLTINSTAFPNVAFNNPPIVCPNFALSSSVVKLNSAASGTIARKFSTNTALGFHPSAPPIIPSGTNTSSTFT
jgi:hypothetical protein